MPRHNDSDDRIANNVSRLHPEICRAQQWTWATRGITSDDLHRVTIPRSDGPDLTGYYVANDWEGTTVEMLAVVSGRRADRDELLAAINSGVGVTADIRYSGHSEPVLLHWHDAPDIGGTTDLVKGYSTAVELFKAAVDRETEISVQTSICKVPLSDIDVDELLGGESSDERREQTSLVEF